MTEEKRNIDLLFRQGLKGYREKTPVHAWDRLEHDLSKASRIKRLVYVRWLAASVLIIFAFSAGYFYATLNSEKQPAIVGNGTEILQNKSQIPAPEITQKQELSKQSQPKENRILPKKSKLAVTEKNKLQTEENLTSGKETPIINKKVELAQNREPSIEKIAENKVAPETPTDTIGNIINPVITEQLKQDSESKNELSVNESNPYNPFNESDYETDKSDKRNVKWAIGAQFAPVLSYREISTTYSSSQQNLQTNTESSLNQSENALLSYAGGFDVNYGMSSHWSIQSGLYLSRIGQVNNDALNFKKEQGEYLLYSIRTSTGEINVAFEKVPENIKKINPPKDTLSGLDLNDIKVIQNIDLFEIPFLVRYKILDKRLSINISGGLSPAYLLKNSTYLQVNNDKYNIGSSSNLNNVIFNSTVGMGIEYFISRKFAIDLEPVFKYSLNPLNNDSEFSYHPYYFSCFTGVRYKF